MRNIIKLFTMLLAVINIINAQVDKDTIEVGTGWNMIGSLSNGISSELIRTEPSDIIVSPFYGYNPGGGYEAKDTLKKGTGYWVKVSEDGLIIFRWLYENSCPGTPAVDYASKIYNTVQIGSQCWLRENLDVGVRINGISEQTDNSTIEKYCYNNDPSNCDKYGGLYQWQEVMQYTTAEGAQGICPPSWHVPTYAEFQTLSTNVGNDGNALKAVGQGRGDGVGTNTSGFTALLVGYRNLDGSFLGLSDVTFIWSSTAGIMTSKELMSLIDNSSMISIYGESPEGGFSVRCIKD
jgi:uncharacterized protein (TIGR02145 family)